MNNSEPPKQGYSVPKFVARTEVNSEGSKSETKAIRQQVQIITYLTIFVPVKLRSNCTCVYCVLASSYNSFVMPSLQFQRTRKTGDLQKGGRVQEDTVGCEVHYSICVPVDGANLHRTRARCPVHAQMTRPACHFVTPQLRPDGRTDGQTDGQIDRASFLHE